MDQLISPEDLANLFDMPVDTLYKWHQLKKGPRVIHLGERLIRYSLPEVEKWVLLQNPQKGAIDLAAVFRQHQQERNRH